MMFQNTDHMQEGHMNPSNVIKQWVEAISFFAAAEILKYKILYLFPTSKWVSDIWVK